ncbi:glycosyltransferase family 2 protein [Marinilabiliaceae bacterium JC040]|nr:glycosyltransferase family 2 protein [Marinilabiliaceae bacterium JC040]
MQKDNIYIKNLISVIIPVYNSAKTIRETLNSVIKQTYDNIEVIIIDDCSTDETVKIILDFAKIDTRINLFSLDYNSGAAVARNYGINKAKGQYLAFIDSDDLWLKDKLQKQIDTDYPFVYTAIKMINDNNEIIKDKLSVPLKVSYNYLLRNTIIVTSSVLINRNIIGDFNMPLRRSGQDYATWLLLLRRTKYAYGIDEALVLYRKGKNSLSSNKLKSINQVYEIQTKNESISKIKAFFNTLCFCMYAFKKHYLK